MAVPKQIEDAAELATQLFEEMNQPHEESAQEEETQEDETQDEETDDAQRELEELRAYKARYESLKGKYDKEVPRLSHELETFKAQVFERLGEKEKASIPADEKLEKFKEGYGEELMEYVSYLAELKAKEAMQSSMQPVQQQIATMEENNVQTAQRNFMAYLDDKTEGKWRPLWEGKDQKFIDFLQQPDPSGLYTYGELVELYNDKWDADKLTKVFDAYWSSQPAPRQPKPQNNSRDALIAPSRTQASSSPTTQEKRIWTGEMIRQFQNDDRQKKYDADTSAAMWNDLLAAPSENRVRG